MHRHLNFCYIASLNRWLSLTGGGDNSVDKALAVHMGRSELRSQHPGKTAACLWGWGAGLLRASARARLANQQAVCLVRSKRGRHATLIRNRTARTGTHWVRWHPVLGCPCTQDSLWLTQSCASTVSKEELTYQADPHTSKRLWLAHPTLFLTTCLSSRESQ